MILSDKVKVSSRFQRSIRIDSDIGDAEIIESFVFPQSSIDVLANMAVGRSKAGEAAFTWTGPYGSGKSSLVVSLNALIGKDKKLHKLAKKSLPKEDAEKIIKGFGVTTKKGWGFVPVVGFKGSAEDALREAITSQYNLKKSKAKTLDIIKEIAEKEDCGLIIVIDEMGKFLEAAADASLDVYFFQQLAELAARSNGKIILLGILHQAFAEYARRLTRDIRDEWSKIQGRFVDMPLNVAGEELIELVGCAIQSEVKPSAANEAISKAVAKQISNWKPVNENILAKSLSQCWPLHPVTAALLGPVSRRRFGQNQRSVFGFLNSSEPNGFQDFLRNTDLKSNNLFSPARFWDYLKSNLEPSIVASPDGHRWSLAIDALSRTEAFGGDQKALEVLKCIALMDLFQERSGLVPEKSLLLQCVEGLGKKGLDKVLSQLETWSVLIFKKHKKSYSLYEGSDFDIEAAIEDAQNQVSQLDFDRLRKAAGFQPIVAKKHYHQTGALRWMDVDLVPSEQALERVENYIPTQGAMGLFMVVLGAEDDSEIALKRLCKKASDISNRWPIITSAAKNSSFIRSYANELQSLEWIKNQNLSLGGDTVARREVESRLASTRARLGEHLTETLAAARWYSNGKPPVKLSFKALHELASEHADNLYKSSPRINSELANRIKPSSNSNAAIRILLKAMVEHKGSDRLGIIGYPAEGGLYETLIAKTGLYDGKSFATPPPRKDLCRVLPLWKAADSYFKKNKNRSVGLTELYELWKRPPYGVKDGLLPFFAVAYIMTRINDYAAYLEGVYRPSIDDLFIDILMKSPKDIALRQMNFSDVGQKILAGICSTLNKIHEDDSKLTETSEPLEIARRLVSTVINLPPWVLRTRHLSKNAIRLRELVKNASDPNKVLFDDLPHLFKEYESNLSKGDVQPIISELDSSLVEMVEAYPVLLDALRQELLDELQVSSSAMLGLEELNLRAKNVMHVSGDFKLDAFAARLSNYTDSQEDIEGIASLAADKPTRDWIDLDVSRAKLRIAELSQQFNHIEAYGRVHNREDYRQAVAFMVGVNGKPKTYVHEFTVKQTQQGDVLKIEEVIRTALNGQAKAKPELLLAALANIGAELLEDKSEKDQSQELKKASA